MAPEDIAILQARLRRADELLERVRQWFEQNEDALKRAGIGGFNPETSTPESSPK